MKTLKELPNNRYFIIVRNNGINSDAIVTTYKYLGAMTASMLYGPKCGSKVYNIIVSDIDKETVKEFGFNTGSEYVHRFSFNHRAEKYQKFMEYISNPDNMYIISDCLTSYKFKPFYLLICTRPSIQKVFIKTTKKEKALQFIESQGWELKMIEHVTEQSKMQMLAVYNRFTGHEAAGLGYHMISEKEYSYIMNWNKTKE